MTKSLSEVKKRQGNWIKYVWLVYLGNLFFQPLNTPPVPAYEWWLIGAALTLFLPLYFIGYRVEEQPQSLWIITAIATLGLLYTPFNSGASTFFVYAAAFAGNLRDTDLARRTIKILTGVCLFGGMLSFSIIGVYALYAYVPALIFTVFIGGINLYYAEKDRANTELRLAREEVERLAKIAERERIARDLHDLLGHTLSVITLKSELAARLIERDKDRAGAEIRDVERISREALAEVRSAVRGYRDQGLQGELISAKIVLEAADIALETHTEPIALTPAEESTLAFALREAVTNVVRHSGASRCTLNLFADEEEVKLEIKDDGCGADLSEGSGLKGMRERVAGLGGRLERRTGEGKGTLLRISLPRAKAESARVSVAPLQLELS